MTANVGRAPPRKVMVIGLGNPDRADDGVGPAIAESLAGRLPADVALRIRAGDMLSLIQDWAGFDALVCVDAAAPMGQPGRIHRIDLATGELPRDTSAMSSHAFGLAEAIGLARALDLAPSDIVVYAIEGGSFDGGAPLTPDVAAVIGEVGDLVVAETARLRSGSPELAHA